MSQSHEDAEMRTTSVDEKFPLFVFFGLMAAGFSILAAGTAPNIPIWDSWSWVLLLKRYEGNILTLSQILFYRHNEHPYGVPSILFMLVGRWFAYDFATFSAINTGVLVATGAALAFMAKKAKSAFPILFAITLVVLSPRQYENALFAFQLGFALTPALGTLVAILGGNYCRNGSALKRLWTWALMLTLAGTAGFCSANGIAVSVLVLIIAVVIHDLGALFSALLTMGYIAWWLVTYYVASPTAVSLTGIVQGFFTVAGSPLFENPLFSGIAGLAVVSAFSYEAWWNFRAEPGARRGLIFVGIASLGMIGAVAIGRGALGGINPSRYSSFATPLWVAALALVGRRLALKTQYAVAVALSAVVVWTTVSTLPRELASLNRQVLDNKIVLANFPNATPEQIATLNPGPTEQIRELAQFLKSHLFSAFSEEGDLPEVRHVSINDFAIAGEASFRKTPLGAISLKGPNHIYKRLPCINCWVVLKAEIEHVDRANIGLIFRSAGGVETLNFFLPADGHGGKIFEVSQRAPEGTVELDAYVYAATSSDNVIFRDFYVTTVTP